MRSLADCEWNQHVSNLDEKRWDPLHLMWAPVNVHSRHHLLQAMKLPVERGARHQKYMAISSPNSKANFFELAQLKWSVEGLLTGLQTSSSTHKKVIFGQQTEGTKLVLVHRAKRADFRSPLRDRRRHGRRRVFILQIIGPRSHIDSMGSEFLLDMSDTDNIPRRVALGNCEENMESISEELRMWDLGTHTCWGNAGRAGPIGPISTGSSEIAAVSLWSVWNLTSTRVSRSVVWRKRVCLTKAIHATWNASVTGLQVLHSCLGRRDLSNKWVKWLKQLRKKILGPCHCNFNNTVFGKTTVAPA